VSSGQWAETTDEVTRRNGMRLKCLLILLVLSLTSDASCRGGLPKPKPQGRGDFIDAKMTSDGKVGLFTFNRTIPLSSEYQRSPFSPPPKVMAVGLVVDRIYVGTYNLETGAIKILLMKENTEWIPGGYKLYITSLSGETALIWEYGQRRETSSWKPNGYYLLDIKSGRLNPLPLLVELAQRNSKLEHAYLIDPDGTLLIETGLPDAPAYADPRTPPGLWVRHPSGEYLLLDYKTNYYPEYSSDGKIYYSSASYFPAPPHQGMKVYNVKTRTSTEVDYRNVTKREYADSSLSIEGFGHLAVSRRIKDSHPAKWEEQTLEINTDALK